MKRYKISLAVVFLFSVYSAASMSYAQSPPDCIACTQCSTFEEWKSVCSLMSQLCYVSGISPILCDGQESRCEKKVNDLLEKCWSISCEGRNNCGTPLPQCTGPAQCNDNNACTADLCTNGNCGHNPIIACTSGDGCCPSGCTSAGDNDCSTPPQPLTCTLYVAKTGNDNNPGTETQPWLTIQKAADTAVAGDTVCVKTGTYNERVTVQNSGNANNWITFSSYPGETATIDGTGIPVPNWEGLVHINGKSYINISGFKIDNSQWASVFVTQSSHVNIEKNTIYNAVSSGILMAQGDNYVADGNSIELAANGGPSVPSQEIISIQYNVNGFEVKNNHVFNAGVSMTGGEGIDAKFGASNGAIHHNLVHDVRPVGIYVDAYDFPQSNIDVYDNVVHNTAACLAAAAEQSNGILDTVNFYNNICYDNYWSMYIGSDNGMVKNIKVIGNTFVDTDPSTMSLGIEIGSFEGNSQTYGTPGFVDNVVVSNNIISQKTQFQIVVDQRPGVTNVLVDHNLIDGFRGYADEVYGTNYITGDPKFVNLAGRDFHLQPSSPAIDAGASLAVPFNFDFDNNARPQGNGYDIGAYESGSQTPPQQPSPLTCTHYVAKNGNNANPGTGSQPWLTIQKAADTAVAGDTVCVKTGTYNEHVSITSSGSSGNYITLAANPGDTVTIDGIGNVGSWDGIIHVKSANWIKIAGFTVKNSNWNGIMIDDSGGSPSSNIIIQNNLVRDIGYSGILAASSNHITLDGNTITQTQTHGHGGPNGQQTNENLNLIDVDTFEIKNNKIYDVANFESIDVKIKSTNGLIHHNDVKPVQSAGIYVDARDGLSENIDIYDNYVHDGGDASTRGIIVGAENTAGHATNIRIFNNIIKNMPATGIHIPWYSPGTVDHISIVSNTVYKADIIAGWMGGIGLEENANGGSTSDIIVRNNIVSQNGVAQIYNGLGTKATITNNLIDGSGGTTGTDHVTGDPQFVDANGGDFHLRSTSPAIDKGTSTGAPNVDFDGTTRPKGAGFDIGAYEKQ